MTPRSFARTDALANDGRVHDAAPVATRWPVTRILKWFGIGCAVAALAVTITGYVRMRPEALRLRVERSIAEHLNMATTLGALSVSVALRPTIVGEHLELRLPGQPQLPPVVTIERFSVRVGVIGMLRGHVGNVLVEGLKIAIPPGDAKHDLVNSSRTHGSGESKIIIDHLSTSGAEVTILRRNPRHRPLVFAIHDLQVDELGYERAIPFTASLTNPVPRGEVLSHGTIGPWAGHPATLPIRGDYTFREADLDTIKGIGGLLTSEGQYDGTLSAVQVSGKTETPDFNLDLGGKPVPLSTTFKATVNGSNGTTHLDDVQARIFKTAFHVTGDVENVPGPEGFNITLDAAIQRGRIEDVLRLVMDNPKPFLTGDVALRCGVLLPAGHASVRERLRLNGRFSLNRAEFTGDELRDKIARFSRRTQGKSQDEPLADHTLTNMAGGFQLKSGVMALRDLTFGMPGATIALSGDYKLTGGALDLEGSLRMQTSMSKAVGGIKSIFLKPFNWLFRRDGAGAVIPIKISGTRDKPSFGIRLGAALTRGK